LELEKGVDWELSSNSDLDTDMELADEDEVRAALLEESVNVKDG
jgi:hypothetical protein